MNDNKLSRYSGLAAVVAGAFIFVGYVRRVLTVAAGADVAVVVAAASFLGIAVGASLVAAVGERAGRGGRATLGLNALLFGAAAFIAGAAVGHLPLAVGGSAGAAWLVAAVYVVAGALPLGFVGFALGVAFRTYGDEPGRVYGAFLGGGAAGVILGAAAFAFSGAAAALTLAVVVGAAGAVLLNPGRTRLGLAAPAVAAALAVALPLGVPSLFRPAASPGTFLGASGSFPAASAWSASARAELVGAAAGDPTAPLFTIFDAGIVRTLPEHEWLAVDGRGASPVTGKAPSREFVKKFVPAFAGGVKTPERALVFGGGGFDALALSALGAGDIDLVVDGAARKLLKRLRYPEETLREGRVAVHAGNGRAFLRGTADTYDLIAFSPAALPAALEPAPALVADYLFTVEAFREYYRRLAPAGIVSFTIKEGAGPPYGLKIVAAARQAFAEEGELKPAGCVAVFRRGDAVTFLAKRGGFGDLELEGLVGLAGDDLEAVYLPGRTPPATASAKTYAALLAPAGGKPNFAGYDYDVRPARDDRPFPFRLVKWNELALSPASAAQVFGLAACAVSVLLAAAFLVVPVYGFKRGDVRTGGKAGFALYFLLAGAAFGALAASLGPKVAFYVGGGAWGGPASRAILLGVAAAGSLLGGAITRGRRWLPFVVVAAATLLCLLTCDAVLTSTSAWPLWVRFYAAILLVAGVGFFLGAFVPLGLGAAAGREPATLPWSWAAYVFGLAFAGVGAPLAATATGLRGVLAAALVLAMAAWGAFVWATRSHLPPVGAEAEGK